MGRRVPTSASRRVSARWELVGVGAGVGVVVAVAMVVSQRLELFDAYVAWSRAHRGVLDLDEVVTSTFVGVLAFAFYAWHRYNKTAALEVVLASQTERYRSLFELNPVAVFSLDAVGGFTSANPAALALSGYTERALLEKKFLEVVAGNQRASSSQGFADVMNRTPRRSGLTLIAEDGHSVALAVTTLPLVIDDEVVGVFGLAQDIGERARTLRELESARRGAEHASELKSLFVANVSHEIRTPLTSVLACTEMLGDTDLDHYQRDLLGKAEHGGRRLLRLVEDLLDFSELQAGRARIDSEAFDARVLAAKINAWAESAAEQKGLRYTCEVEATLGAYLTGDRAKVTQVLTGLVENALKFTESGAVHVSIVVNPAELYHSQGCVRFVVSDSGIGLSDVQQARAFDSFSQADESVSRSYGGAGLGLAICRQLVSLMGGSIWVDSTLGAGSSFTFHLPQGDVSASASPTVQDDSATQVALTHRYECVHTAAS